MEWMEKIRLPHVGFRKVKSVLAIFVGFWFWQLLRLFFPALEAHPIFIYIYGMIEIRDTSEKTVDFGKKRIKSTFTALGVGIPCMVLLESLKGIAPEGWIHTGLELIIIIGGVLLTLEVAQKVINQAGTLVAQIATFIPGRTPIETKARAKLSTSLRNSS